MRKRSFRGSLALCAGVLFAWAAPLSAQADVNDCPAFRGDTASEPLAVVQYLAAPAVEGRGTGTPGEICAQAYIAEHFHRLGLRAAGEAGTFLQPVTVWGTPSQPPANVIGILRGSDSKLQDQVIVVGAHHDHLGRDSTGAIYPGADDNASGVATLLRVAQLLAVNPPARSVAFVTFTSEEMGLLGSKTYVEHPPLPLTETVAMINLDMVGRMHSRPLQISGLSSSPRWAELLGKANTAGLPLHLDPAIQKGSDHLSFHRAGVSVLYLTTGSHADQHQPSDTWEKVDASGLESVAQFVSRLVRSFE